MKENRYTVTEHRGTFDTNARWYSLQDHKQNTDLELDHKQDRDYAIEVCRKFNREDRQGLHDDDLILVNGCYVHMAE